MLAAVPLPPSRALQMNILAFDTCFNACSVAAARGLGGAQPETSEHVEAMASGHAERLMPMIREAMAAVRLTFGELDRIAVTAGPGSFTGTRITVAAARALALSTGVPIVAFSSLAVMAAHPMAAFTRRAGDLAIAVDARRGEVYFELFPRLDSEAGELSGPALLTYAAAAELLSTDGPTTVAGSGAEAVVSAARALGRDAEAILPDLVPRIGDILADAMTLPPLTTPLKPAYARPPDARPPSSPARP